MHLEEMKRRLKGLVVVQLFPFTDSGELDLEGLRENTEFLVDFAENGEKDLVILTNGSTSEFYAMSDEEQERAIETVVETSGEVPVIAGTSRPGTDATVEFSKRAQRLGADGVMVVLPYYHQPTEEGLYRHYKAVGEAVDVGIMLYNNPFVSGSWADPELLARISQIEEMIAFKENTSSAIQYQEISRKVDPEKMTLICGLGEKMYPGAQAYGAKGFVSTPGNFAPHLSYAIYEAGREEDVAGMREALDQFKPYFDFLDKATADREETTILPDTRRGNPVYQALGKLGLDYVGLNGGRLRAPMEGLTEEEEREAEEVFDRMGL